ncbi:MAG: hypothetical protein WA865_17515 [Spirulinaceae cyanobacterium]
MVDFLIRPGIKQDFATVASIYNESIAAENSTMDEDFYTAENVGSLVDKFNVLQTALLMNYYLSTPNQILQIYPIVVT